ncbi:hypothetical protein TNCV_3391901 [Trichonephila clavipes]|nr:hypothetical protein TNCV_3391901 [Trichonephila clavipes]
MDKKTEQEDMDVTVMGDSIFEISAGFGISQATISRACPIYANDSIVRSRDGSGRPLYPRVTSASWGRGPHDVKGYRGDDQKQDLAIF